MEQIKILNLAKKELIHEISDLELRQMKHIEKYGCRSEAMDQIQEKKQNDLDVIYEHIRIERCQLKGK